MIFVFLKNPDEGEAGDKGRTLSFFKLIYANRQPVYKAQSQTRTLSPCHTRFCLFLFVRNVLHQESTGFNSSALLRKVWSLPVMEIIVPLAEDFLVSEEGSLG